MYLAKIGRFTSVLRRTGCVSDPKQLSNSILVVSSDRRRPLRHPSERNPSSRLLVKAESSDDATCVDIYQGAVAAKSTVMSRFESIESSPRLLSDPKVHSERRPWAAGYSPCAPRSSQRPDPAPSLGNRACRASTAPDFGTER